VYATAQHKSVFIDRGAQDGVGEGMIFRIFLDRDPDTDEAFPVRDSARMGHVQVAQVSEQFSTGIVYNSRSIIQDESPAVLLTDVSDIDLDSKFNAPPTPPSDPTAPAPPPELTAPAPEASPVPPAEGTPSDDLDRLDDQREMSDQEKRELEQLEQWKKANPDTPPNPELPPGEPGDIPSEIPTDEIFFKVSKEVQAHPHFNNQTNVEFVKIISDDLVEVRVFERGAGETLACGSGACAVVAVMIKNNLSKSKKITTRFKGGDLIINWPSETSSITMTGGYQKIFVGTIDESF
jgi:DNA-dependent RNA polymerase auxiliary subunit epsilon